jgi:hypothetical protein
MQGSRNIDLMREQIPEFIRMVMGYVHSYNCHRFDGQPKFTFEFKSESCVWKVTQDVSTASYRVECWAKESFGESLIFATNNQVPLKSGNVLRVYRDLQVLLEGLSKEFPKLESDWQYLIDASDVVLAK